MEEAMRPAPLRGEVFDPTRNVLQLVEAAVKRIDDLRTEDSRRIEELAQLRANYGRELREAEARRLDAIRLIDMNTTTATAQALASSMAQMQHAFDGRLSSLERNTYESQGKQAYQDPLLVSLKHEVESISSQQTAHLGASRGLNAGWVILVGAIGLLATLISTGALIYTLATTPSRTEVVPQAAPAAGAVSK